MRARRPPARSRRGTYTSRRASAQRLGDVEQQLCRERCALLDDAAECLFGEAQNARLGIDGEHVERAIALHEERRLAEDVPGVQAADHLLTVARLERSGEDDEHVARGPALLHDTVTGGAVDDVAARDAPLHFLGAQVLEEGARALEVAE